MKVRFEEITQYYLGRDGEIVTVPTKAYKTGEINFKEFATDQTVSFETVKGTTYKDVIIFDITASKLTVEDKENVKHVFQIDNIKVDSLEITQLNGYQLKAETQEA